ncbi:MAG TPA: hypothetical protein VJM08_07790, partial [Anaerolineales bacterium]|nr:hypothetical protein [Anaerolineales bacterium]
MRFRQLLPAPSFAKHPGRTAQDLHEIRHPIGMLRKRRRLELIVLFTVLLSSCNIRLNNSPNNGIQTPTPFQPQTENPSDSLYSASAPTPVYLPTPLPPTPTEVLIQPESLPADLSVSTLTVPPNLNPLTGLSPSDPSLLERRPMAIKVANYPRYIRPQSGLTLAD